MNKGKVYKIGSIHVIVYDNGDMYDDHSGKMCPTLPQHRAMFNDIIEQG